MLDFAKLRYIEFTEVYSINIQEAFKGVAIWSQSMRYSNEIFQQNPSHFATDKRAYFF